MSLREHDAVDVETTIAPYNLPPTAKVLRHGGRYEIEDSQRIPSLPELIRSLASVDVDFEDPAIAGLVPEHDVTRFVVQHGIRLEETLRLLRREEPYESFIKKGLLQSIYLNLLLYEEGDPVLSEVGVPLPVAELHSPPVFGCESAYEVAAERVREAGLKLEVRGMGAGGGVSARLNFRDRLWTEAECGQITIKGNIEVVPWTNRDQGKTIHLVSITDISAGEWSLTEIPTGRTHLCSARFDELLATFTERERQRWVRPSVDFFRHTVSVGGGLERSRTVERSRRFSLDFGGLLELKSQFTSEYTYSYKITGKADYLAFYEDPQSEAFFWTWKDL